MVSSWCSMLLCVDRPRRRTVEAYSPQLTICVRPSIVRKQGQGRGTDQGAPSRPATTTRPGGHDAPGLRMLPLRAAAGTSLVAEALELCLGLLGWWCQCFSMCVCVCVCVYVRACVRAHVRMYEYVGVWGSIDMLVIFVTRSNRLRRRARTPLSLTCGCALGAVVLVQIRCERGWSMVVLFFFPYPGTLLPGRFQRSPAGYQLWWGRP